jgi:hypothetical protein
MCQDRPFAKFKVLLVAGGSHATADTGSRDQGMYSHNRGPVLGEMLSADYKSLKQLKKAEKKKPGAWRHLVMTAGRGS